VVARVAPAILGLLADGVPRSNATIVKALAGRHAEDEVELTLIRLAVTERVRETGSTLAAAGVEPDELWHGNRPFASREMFLGSINHRWYTRASCLVHSLMRPGPRLIPRPFLLPLPLARRY
jgi:hypothetical protein